MIATPNSKTTDYIVLEFNELCPGFMKQFIDAAKLPNFKRLRDNSVQMITDADEAPPRLEPWIQWATIHSGLKAEEHRIFDLGEGQKLKEDSIGKILSDSGVSVGVLGSMNTNYGQLSGFHVPDPWSLDGIADPKELQPFYETVAKQVQESSTDSGISKKDIIKFGWFMLRHGMRPETIKAGMSQLMAERKDAGVKWRRSLILERIQYDFFRYLKRKYNPQFSTFFCNSTAHFQHYYWRNMEPDIFAVPPGDDDHPSLQTAIEEGYTRMDAIVGKFLKEFPESKLILLTALSQKPWRETTKCTFRPIDFGEFLKFVGVSPTDVEIKPVMAEEFHLICKSPDQREAISEKLLQATVNGQPAMKARKEENGLFCGCVVNDFTARQCTISHPTGGERAFDDLFHMVHSMRSGRHHPHGLFWIQSDTPHIVDEPVRLVDVAPTLLDLYGVAAPDYMTGTPLTLAPQQLAEV